MNKDISHKIYLVIFYEAFTSNNLLYPGILLQNVVNRLETFREYFKYSRMLNNFD